MHMFHHVLLLLLLRVLPCFTQFQVLYRENQDHIWNSSQPVRFWELVEYRPTTTPPPTTTTEYIPPPTTTPTTTTTTKDPCESSHPLDLTRRLRDTAGYNRIYMASDFSSARNEFPDLRGLAHKASTDYHCGKRCQRSSQLIRKIIKTGQPAEAERAWWDEEEWEEGERRRKRAIEWKDTDDRLLMRNTGTSRHILGMTVAVECDDETGEFNSGGYSLCTTCRAVRHLPSTYFPRVINELICSQKACLRGEGKCIQRVMPMKVLRNVGTRECARWQMSQIDVRTCCDCMLNPSSPLVTYL
ncbi:Bursicon subunit alpha [Caenorhabditis elegans]|uniref:Bursicon subunit alpha n=2 Tax=Caenorhabditis elegans TaxID=6239 RepID=V6CLD9_CAEEL|nr:Bursicon subunit alpha [Caenorhabditis elegans]CDK13380.1 Bursicon subunit alpha [Caenorhabditis elegans]|eukprot:NP_001293188.1 Uncharacterized protein CELE_Y95B8A.6 [Caenorhabditis elegans]